MGTVTEIYDYLRLLFSRIGQQYCPDCHVPVQAYTPGAILEEVRRRARKNAELLVLSPLVKSAKVKADELLEKVEKSGFEWVRVNGK